MATQSFVPSIDISPFLDDANSATARQVVRAVRAACLKTGFFQITGHGMSRDVQDDLFDACQKFFALPMKSKEELDARHQTGRRGYDMMESQTYDSETPPDLKEGFYIGHDIPLDDPVVKAGRFFMGPNVWPEETELAGKDFREPVQRYFAAVNELALKVLDLVAHTLPYGPDVFRQFSTGYVIAPLRLLHYPPNCGKSASGKTQLGAGAHTDFGAITLLLQDGNPGLEVLNNATNEFVPIEPTRGSFVVNVGDMLSSWTGGRYKSSIHRVINPRPHDRYSAAFFFDGSLDCPLDPLDGSEAQTLDWTVEKHMIKRIMDSYGS